MNKSNIVTKTKKKKSTLFLFFRNGLSTVGSVQTFFYTEVTDQMKISEGGGLANEGEDIEVIEYTIPQIRDMVTQSEILNASNSLLFGLMWFLTNKIVLST